MKEQAAGIVKEKVTEICTLVPAFNRELDRRPGKTREGKDYVCYVFKNGSYFDNIAARESSRGKRRHGGLVEECVGVDGTILSEVIIPTMNVSRLCMDGSTQPSETLNKSQIYVTTAGWKGTFARVKKIIGELKPREPQNEGVSNKILANSESLYMVTLCQVA